MARPLSGHDFDAVVVNRIDFDRRGLIVAEESGRVVGFAHAGFGPDQPDGPSQRLDRLLGTVAMLVVDPAEDVDSIGRVLMTAAEAYLGSLGAQVLYAGGQSPLDPFYRAIYGGSEWAGILDEHVAFRRVVESAGYNVVSRSCHLSIDLAAPEVRDPKAPILRRQARLEVAEDARPAGWWEALAAHPGSLARYRLIGKADDVEIAHATTWDMAAFGRHDGRALVGLRGVEVAAPYRRKGFGRHLVAEILRQARGEWAEAILVATDEANRPALALYQSVGFRIVGGASLYRKAGA